MPMAFHDAGHPAIEPRGKAGRIVESRLARAKAHSSAEVCRRSLGHKLDHRMGRLRVEFGGIGIFKTKHRPSDLNHSALHAKANS